MRYELTRTTTDAHTTIRTTTTGKLVDVEQQAQHLRSWALIRGATISGHAYLRLLGEGDTAVMEQPTTEAVIAPNKETGLEVDMTDGGPALVVANVPFGEVRAVVRALRQEFGAACGRTGAADFLPADGQWKTGTLTWHVRELPDTLPTSIEVAEETPVAVAAAGAPETAAPASTGRRFSLHLPRWRRQNG